MTYEQAREDHEYLWGLSPAYDMTGGYVDSHDLDKLLRSPTKKTAKNAYGAQIDRWFTVGTEFPTDYKDKKLDEIAERHNLEDELQGLRDE